MSNATRLSVLAKVQQATSGSSWQEFLDLYSGLIPGWLERKGLPDHDTDHLEQEVLTVVLREIGSFQHSGRTGAFCAWLKSITSNCLRDRQGRSHRHLDGPDLADIAAQLDDSDSRQSTSWNAEHDRYVINRVLQKISERMSVETYEAFQRVVINGEPAKDVAEDLDISLGAVRVAQHRVLRDLKRQVEGLVDC